MSESSASDPFLAFEHGAWQVAAPGYINAWTSLTSQSALPLLDVADVGTGTRLLDVASGPGFVSSAAASRGATVIGIDFSSEMVTAASKSFPACDFRQGNAESLDFDDESFDAVVMNFGMLHLGHPDRAVAEAFRVLRPGGNFAFTVWAPPTQAKAFSLVLDAVAAYGAKVALPAGPDFFTFSDPAMAAAALTSAGFAEPVSTTVPLEWTLPNPEAVFKAFFHGTARTGALLRGQSVEVQRTIADALAIEAKQFQTADGTLNIPMPCVMSSARKPS